jgi:ParB-like chromosome segregation protein Spo0J
MNQTTLLPTLYKPTQTLDGKQLGQFRSTIVQAAQALNDVKWGAAGHITGMTVRIPRKALWTSYCSVEYDDATVHQMADSLRSQGQLKPLTVTPAKDTRSRAEGGTGGKYLILDGRLRWEAAPWTGLSTLEELDCIVEVYADAYAATLAGVTMKTAQHALDDKQAGQLLRRLYDVYKEASARGLTTDAWPKQEELARIFGRSQPTIARWMGIARLDVTVRDALEEGRIEVAQAQELIHAAPRVQIEVAEEVEASNEAGTPMTQKEVRTAVNERKREATHGPRQDPGSVLVHPPQQLRLPFLAEKPAPDAMRDLAHDLHAWLGDTLEEMTNPDPDWLAVYKALNRPRIVGFFNGPYGAEEGEEG